MTPKGADHELPHIPLEILQKIAGHLDRKSALALTLTCKGLRDAGETRLWSELDITSGWNEPIGECLLLTHDSKQVGVKPCWCKEFSMRTRLGGSRGSYRMGTSTHTTDERGFPLPDPDAAAWLALQKTAHERCLNALRALEAYEYRAQCVRSVRLEPSDGVDGSTAKNMMALLTLVAPYIKHLDIVPLPWGEDDHPTDVTEDQAEIVMAGQWFDYMADQVPCKYKLTCPRLKTLRIAVPASSEDTIPLIINRLAPSATSGKGLRASESGRTRLSDLRIESSGSSWPELLFEDLPRYEGSWKSAPLLDTVKSVTFSDVQNATSSDIHMIELLSRATNIEVLRVLMVWSQTTDRAGVWRAIVKLKKLKTLMLFSEDGMDDGLIGRQPLQIEELVRDDAELDEQEELSWTVR